jgi:hypothetical protein
MWWGYAHWWWFCGEAAAEEFDEKTDANPAKEPSEKQKKKPGE